MSYQPEYVAVCDQCGFLGGFHFGDARDRADHTAYLHATSNWEHDVEVAQYDEYDKRATITRYQYVACVRCDDTLINKHNGSALCSACEEEVSK